MKQGIRRLILFALTIMVVCVLVPITVLAAEGAYCTEAEAVAAIRQAMVERKSEVTLQIAGEVCPEEGAYQYADDLMNLAMEHTGNPKEGDYLRFQLRDWFYGGSYYEENGVGYYDATFSINYYDTLEQQASMDELVADVLASMDLAGKTDAEKIRSIYDYITTNVTYDYEHLGDSTYTLQYTAYGALVNGTAVCQGYANLLYRLALELGIDCRIISGISNGQNHAWNIVKLDGMYYCLDATWDAGSTEYRYFLRGSDWFIKHESDAKYLTSEFTTAYPISKKDYAVVSGQEPDTWVNYAADGFSGGSGTESDPYVIKTASELALLAKHCNQMNEAYNRCYYILGCDIDLAGYDWMPIGAIEGNSDSNYLGFHGSFDGKGYTISNLLIDQDNDRIYQFGLFGFSDGTIKNVILKDVSITFDSPREGWQASNGMGSSLEVGGLCGWNGGLIENCIVSNVNIDVSSKMSLMCGGAVANHNYARMKNVVVSGSVSGLAARAIWAGGCLGSNGNETTVEACGFSGTVRAETEDIDHMTLYDCVPVHYVGGFCADAGRAHYDITIKDCYAVADIYSKYPYPTQSVGAFAGAIGIVYDRGIYENLVGNAQITADRDGVISRGVSFWQGELGFSIQTDCEEWRYRNCVAVAGDEIVVNNMDAVTYDSQSYSAAKVSMTDLLVNTLGFNGDLWRFDEAGLPYFSGKTFCSHPNVVTGNAVSATDSVLGYTGSKICTLCGGIAERGKQLNYNEPIPEETKPTEPTPTEPEPTEPLPTEPTLPENVDRIYGDNRYKTGFTVADQLKKTLGVEKYNTIIVAYGSNFADALAGSYLAAQKNAPILLVNKNTINDVKDYIVANLSSGGTVYLLGGTAAVPAEMETALAGLNVKRLAGTNRYATNLLILAEAGTNGQEILICTGKGFADSLSASAVNKPILLVNKKLDNDQKAFLQNSSGKFIIIGGESAVSAELEAELKAYGSVERIGGANRYETSVAVAKRFFSAPKSAVLAYAKKFPDGLCGGPLAYSMNAPLILTATKVETAAAAYTKENGIKSGCVLGGSSLISDEAVAKIFG